MNACWALRRVGLLQGRESSLACHQKGRPHSRRPYSTRQTLQSIARTIFVPHFTQVRQDRTSADQYPRERPPSRGQRKLGQVHVRTPDERRQTASINSRTKLERSAGGGPRLRRDRLFEEPTKSDTCLEGIEPSTNPNTTVLWILASIPHPCPCREHSRRTPKFAFQPYLEPRKWHKCENLGSRFALVHCGKTHRDQASFQYKLLYLRAVGSTASERYGGCTCEKYQNDRSLFESHLIPASRVRNTVMKAGDPADREYDNHESFPRAVSPSRCDHECDALARAACLFETSPHKKQSCIRSFSDIQDVIPW